MKPVRYAAFSLLATAASFSSVANAQTLYDKVIVDLPYPVTLNDTTLQPGHYVIRQLDTQGGGSRVLQIFSDKGMRIETSALTIPTLDNNTPERTDVILHHYGSSYFFDKIWVQGKNYGYEFPLPSLIRSRQKERAEPYTVAARYERTQQPVMVEAAPEPAPVPAPAPEVTAEPVPAPEPQTVTTAPEAAQAPAPVSEAASPAPTRETNRMPTTADGWITEVAAGLVLASAAWLLVRRRIA